MPQAGKRPVRAQSYRAPFVSNFSERGPQAQAVKGRGGSFYKTGSRSEDHHKQGFRNGDGLTFERLCELQKSEAGNTLRGHVTGLADHDRTNPRHSVKVEPPSLLHLVK